VADVLSSQETFKAMVKEVVGPSLRELGFKGSGQRFRFQRERVVCGFGFQKSMHSRKDHVRFTVNVGAYDDTAPIAMGGHLGFWGERIGFLSSRTGDKWWTIAADESTAEVAHDVLWYAAERALPAFCLAVAFKDRPALRRHSGYRDPISFDAFTHGEIEPLLDRWQAEATLIEQLENANPIIRLSVCQRILDSADVESTEMEAVVHQMLTDPETWNRKEIAVLLDSCGGDEQAVTGLRQAAKDHEWDVRHRARLSLYIVGDAEMVQTVDSVRSAS
jgi:hypothetical protein